MSADSSLPSPINSTMDFKKMSRNLKIAQLKVRNTLDVFDPSKYTPDVVKANKDLWIKKVEDAFDVVTELSVELEEFVSPAEAHEMFKFNEALKDEMTKFVLLTNTTALSIKDPPVEKNLDDLENQPKFECIPFPSFSGTKENIFKFKKRMMNALKANDIKEEEYIQELHKCLDPESRGCIPNSIRNIEDAWSILQDVFGDPTGVIKEKLALASLGSYPQDGSSSAEMIQAQVEYLTDVQLVVKDLFELASREPKFRGQVFNCGTLRMLLLKFPIKEMHVMLEFSGPIVRRLHCILDYIKEIRSRRLWLLSRYVDSMSFKPSSVSLNANASLSRS